jgi:predicted alpha/beta superfamily hydrolase
MARIAKILLLALPLLGCARDTPAPRAPSAAPNVRVLAQSFPMPGLDRVRGIRVYLPPSYEAGSRRYPVIYLHDGQNLFDDATSYAGEWGVDEALNALAREKGFEAIAVGIDNGGEKRMQELSPWPNAKFGAPQGEAYMRFIVETVKPYIDANYRTEPGRESTAVIGSSMGGLISHYAMLAHGDVFGRIGVLSPSYWFSPLVYEQTRTMPPRLDMRVVLYAGDAEEDRLVPDVMRMRGLLEPLLGAERLRVAVAAGAKHNEAAWRVEFPATVRFLFELER